jgi:sulfur carrier protein ThiS
VTVEAGQTVRQALAALGIRPDHRPVIANGTATQDYVLKDGDSVELLAVIGGGRTPNQAGRPEE